MTLKTAIRLGAYVLSNTGCTVARALDFRAPKFPV